MPSFHIRLTNDNLVFSSGHFITLPDGQCERLHGHTYRVSAEVHGSLDSSQCVVDFLVLGAALKTIVDELDHRMLLPTQHLSLRVSSDKDVVEVTFGRRRWLFPKDDCLLLPIANTTSEMLAHYIAKSLVASLANLCPVPPDKVRVEVAEGSGAVAGCELP
jgi:6-pyruvoyltetrahydropterin/6-carboxytetrahydropterin synthase